MIPAPTCWFAYCDAGREPGRFLCPAHWAVLPGPLRDGLLEHYEPDVFDHRAKPSPRLAMAIVRARNWIAVKEGRIAQAQADSHEAKVRRVIERRLAALGGPTDCESG